MSSRSMSANVLRAPRKMATETVPFPAMGPRDALIRVAAVGLCGTDYHIFTGEANYHTDDQGRAVPLEDHPQILGHEVSGVVETVGDQVTGLEAGDRVVVDQGLNCVSEAREHRCEYCATGYSHQCEWFREFGITGLPGGLAEFMAVPAINLIRIESARPFTETVMTEPLACVLHAVDAVLSAKSRYSFRSDSKDQAIRCAVICGAGPAGILFVQVLRKIVGYEGTLLVSEPDPEKRALVETLGAETIDPRTEPLVESVLERTGGRRAEFFVDAAGHGALFEEIPGVIRTHGTVLLYAHGHGGTGLEVMNQVQFREPTLLSPCGASGGFDEDGHPAIYQMALRLIEESTIDVKPAVSHVLEGLPAVPDCFASEYGSAGYVKAVTLL